MRFISLLLLTTAFSYAACKNDTTKTSQAPTPTETTPAVATPAATKYAVTTGSIQWTGKKAIKGQHTGTVNISGGELEFTNDALTGGNFNIDMNSIAVVDLKDKEKAELEGHLKAADFFEADKYPTGSFKITGVTAGTAPATHTISGDLTLKSVTKPVTFPATVTMNADGTLKATAALDINRTEWGITFSSSLVSKAKDNFIADIVPLVITIEAKR